MWGYSSLSYMITARTISIAMNSWECHPSQLRMHLTGQDITALATYAGGLISFISHYTTIFQEISSSSRQDKPNCLLWRPAQNRSFLTMPICVFSVLYWLYVVGCFQVYRIVIHYEVCSPQNLRLTCYWYYYLLSHYAIITVALSYLYKSVVMPLKFF